MTEYKILVQPRSVTGKKVKKLRQVGQVIASISTPDTNSLSIQVDKKVLLPVLKEVGESTLLYVKLEGEKTARPTLLEEIQHHPITSEILHVTFKQVSLKEKVEAEVSITFVGEVDVQDSVLVTVKDSVTVEALPTDLPESIEVDLSSLTEIGQTISLADLKIDASKVTLALSEDQNPAEEMVVILQEQKEEVIEEETSAEEESAEATPDASKTPTEEAEAAPDSE